MKFRLIHQDNHLLVIDKPPGLVVDPSITQTKPTLVDLLKQEFDIKLERAGIVHRLDKDTSGLMIVAKTQQALNNLQSQFKARFVKKEYLALVHGFLLEEKEIEAPIGRNPGNREKFTVLSSGKEARTRYVPLEKLQLTGDKLVEIFHEFNKIQFKKLITIHYLQFTLLRCFPLTGRTHQIRVHLKYLGFPIVADDKYTGRKMVRLDKRWCPRQFLHASKIEFNHPMLGERVTFESPLAEDLEKALGVLKPYE